MAYPPEGIDPAFAEQFNLIRQTFILGLVKREDEIVHARSRADRNAALHRLAGAAGTYGFEELSHLARSAIESTDANNDVRVREILDKLKQAFKAIRDSG